MSNFQATVLIRQEIVQTFRILLKHELQKYLHTCGTQQAHHAKNMIFVPVVCTSSCAWKKNLFPAKWWAAHKTCGSRFRIYES